MLSEFIINHNKYECMHTHVRNSPKLHVISAVRETQGVTSDQRKEKQLLARLITRNDFAKGDT